jgi:O-6-methylguanine DNA methyltransferase
VGARGAALSARLAWAWADLGFAPALVGEAGRGICLVIIGRQRAAQRLAEVRAGGAGDGAPAWIEERTPALRAACRQLEDYARRRRTRFELELDLASGTDFERAVWNGLAAIPFGATRTYGELAGALGRPGAARAVGRAAGRNPVPILVPCHRLLARGGLGGFSAGLATKRALLGLEGHALVRQSEFA